MSHADISMGLEAFQQGRETQKWCLVLKPIHPYWSIYYIS